MILVKSLGNLQIQLQALLFLIQFQLYHNSTLLLLNIMAVASVGSGRGWPQPLPPPKKLFWPQLGLGMIGMYPIIMQGIYFDFPQSEFSQ